MQFRDRFSNSWRFILCFAPALSLLVAVAAAEETLRLDPAQSTLKFTLEASLHTVHGSFQLRQGALQFDRASGKVSGDIRADAKSGQSGNGMRDRKMHREILDSEQHPEIVFRPDRVEGSVAAQGKSSVKIHGIFSVRGTEHEIVVPADVEMSGDRWSTTAHFTIPYVKWGMKNPSTLFLRVSDSVEIDLVAAGSLTRRTATTAH
jgi:polyisoprenoid-binding protein YceI